LSSSSAGYVTSFSTLSVNGSMGSIHGRTWGDGFNPCYHSLNNEDIEQRSPRKRLKSNSKQTRVYLFDSLLLDWLDAFQNLQRLHLASDDDPDIFGTIEFLVIISNLRTFIFCQSVLLIQDVVVPPHGIRTRR
jgi:hypothetical protein